MDEITALKAAASILILLILAASLFALWNTTRTAECRYCDHCRRKADDERESKARRRHEAYHEYRPQPLSECNDPDCPGRH